MLAPERCSSSAVHSWMSFGIVMCATRALGERGLDRLVDDVDDVRRPHDALVVRGDVHEQLVEIDVLLVVRADQVVEGVAGDRQHRLAVALGVVQAVQQVDAARARGRQADAEAAGVLGVAARGERRRLLVPHLDEADLVLVRAQRLEDAVDAVAGKAEIVSTPQAISRSTSRSAVVAAISPHLVISQLYGTRIALCPV